MAQLYYPGVVHDFGEFRNQMGCQGIGDIRIEDVTCGMFDRHKIQFIFMFMEFVKTQLIPNPKRDQNKASHPHRKSQDIDRSKQLAPEDISECDFDVILEHGHAPVDGIPRESGKGSHDLGPIPECGFAPPFHCSNVFICFCKVSAGVIIVH